jgi:hypothetical protein
LILLIYLLLERRQAYIDHTIDYAQLSAMKNAPRWIRRLKAIGKWPALPRPASAASVQ